VVGKEERKGDGQKVKALDWLTTMNPRKWKDTEARQRKVPTGLASKEERSP